MVELYKPDLKKSVARCLTESREHYGLPINPREDRYWSFHIFGVRGTLPNFQWRRRAIDCHDIHHLILGAPITTRGECTVAAWEFAAGPYPNLWSQLFCFPLVLAGLVMDTRKTVQVIRQGRRQQTLYGLALDVEQPLGEAQRRVERIVKD